MVEAGGYQVTAAVLTRFRLDGGAMFGSVPKALWEKQRPADELNRIRLVSRVLVLRSSRETAIVDAGVGEKFGPKETSQFAVEAAPAGGGLFRWEELTTIVLTHLHFDHAGGITRWETPPAGASPGRAVLQAPQARVHLQRENWDLANRPGPRERASYLAEHVRPLEGAALSLHEGEVEVLPGVRGIPSSGHTRGMQWILVGEGRDAVAFPADLIPTSTHVHLPFVMGYDMCVETLLREKEAFLTRASREGWIVVFAHDEDVPAARILRTEDGRFRLGEVVRL